MDNIYGNKINQMYNNSGFSVGISNKNDVQLLKSDKKILNLELKTRLSKVNQMYLVQKVITIYF